jgi:death on curing protein
MLLGDGLEKLEGTVHRPEQYAHYEQADIAAQAAVLAQGVVDAHAFRDGNKRTAHLTLHSFLEVNGYTVDAPKRLRTDWILDLANGLAAEAVASSIRQYLIWLP